MDGALDTISGTRIGNELRLLATEPDPVAAFEIVAELDLGWSIDAELARTALAALPPDGSRRLLVLARVFAHAAQPEPSLRQSSTASASRPSDRDAIVEAAAERPDPGRAFGQHHLQGRNRPNRRHGRD